MVQKHISVSTLNAQSRGSVPVFRDDNAQYLKSPGTRRIGYAGHSLGSPIHHPVTFSVRRDPVCAKYFALSGQLLGEIKKRVKIWSW